MLPRKCTTRYVSVLRRNVAYAGKKHAVVGEPECRLLLVSELASFMVDGNGKDCTRCLCDIANFILAEAQRGRLTHAQRVIQRDH